MSGKRTFSHGDPVHPDAGGWSAEIGGDVTLRPSDVERLTAAIDRALTAVEVERIERFIASVRRMPATARAIAASGAPASATRQDVIRTLGALAQMTPVDAADALARVDPASEAELDCAAHALHGTGAADCAAHLPTIAAHALDAVRSAPQAGGRPGVFHTRHVAAFAWASWREFGRDDVAVWHDGAGCSALVAWTSALLHATDGANRAPKQVADLLRETRTQD